MPLRAAIWPEARALSPGVHAVALGGDLVFLDIGADAYFCLPQGAQTPELTPDRRGLIVADEALAEALAAQGLLTSTAREAGAAPRLTVGRPKASAVLDRAPGVRWRDIPPMARSLSDLALTYRGRPFAGLLRTVREGAPMPIHTAPSDALLAVVADFHRWIPYAPVSGKCLLRSFLLLRLLRRRGLDAHWVFGVATWPFRAHCWLQSGDLALDDTVDRLVAFTPILVA